MTQPERGALAGRILNGQYALIGLLGAGGMAEVYRGDDLGLERDVAVKVLPPAFSGNPNLVARFRDEARRVANLSHPHIVPIYALGEDDGLLYIVMPMLRESLRHRLIREERLPPAEAIDLIQQVAGALDAAHAQGIIHRDVKPENILLDAAGSVYLSDFGIARTLARNHAGTPIPTIGTTGIPIGTPQYMAPEQIRCDPLDQRADVYGLAAVLYELLAGVPPHGAVGAYEAAARALAGEIPPLAEVVPDVWPELAAVVMRGLARDRDARYQSAGEFAQALRVALHAQSRHVVESATAGTPTSPADIEAIPTAALTSGLGVSRDAATIPMSGALAPRPAAAYHTGAPAARRRPAALAGALILLLALLVAASAYVLTAAHPGSGASVGGRTGAVATPSAHSTRGAGTPSATRSPGVTPSTSAPSGTPASGAGTPTIVPQVSVSVSPQPFMLQPNGPVGGLLNSCKGTQAVENTSSQAINWSWAFDGTPPSGFQYSVSGSGKTPSGSSAPFTRTDEPAGATDQITVQMACGQSTTVHFTAALSGDPSQSVSFDFTLSSQRSPS